MEGSWSTWRKHTLTQGEHISSTQRRVSQEVASTVCSIQNTFPHGISSHRNVISTHAVCRGNTFLSARLIDNDAEKGNLKGFRNRIIDIYCFRTSKELLSGGLEFLAAPLLAERFSNLKCEMASLLNLHFCCRAVHVFHHLFLP